MRGFSLFSEMCCQDLLVFYSRDISSPSCSLNPTFVSALPFPSPESESWLDWSKNGHSFSLANDWFRVGNVIYLNVKEFCWRLSASWKAKLEKKLMEETFSLLTFNYYFVRIWYWYLLNSILWSWGRILWMKVNMLTMIKQKMEGA